MKLSKLAELLGAQLCGPEEVEITGVGGLHEAGEGQITFIEGRHYLKDLEQSRASAVVAPFDFPEMNLPVLKVKNPKLAFARLLEFFYVKPYSAVGISDKAAVGRDVRIGSDCSIHAFAVLSDRVRIGDRVTIHCGSYIGEDSVVEDDTVIYPNVSIGHRIAIGKRVIIHSGTVVGSDGFGYVTDGGRHYKIPQVGGVIIEDEVEIGGNCTIDRATLGNTIIKKGSKLDNQVHVAHNVVIGEHCLIAGQAGVAGSSTLGNYVVLAGQAGVGDHRKIGDRVMAGGKAVITHDIEAGQAVAGFHAMPLRDWLKVQAVLPRLPELKKAISNLEKQIQELKAKNV